MSRTNYAGQDWSGPVSKVNRDPETGIRYGIIPSHDVSHWALETIYEDGRDLDYESFIAEVKAQLKQAVTEILDFGLDSESPGYGAAVGAAKAVLRKALEDFLFRSRLDSVVDELMEDIEDEPDVEKLAEKLFDAISDQLGDSYQGTGDCTRMGYEEDGYGLQIDGSGDLWVFKSPYFTYAQWCSPCAPGACYLKNPLDGVVESNKCYCLGLDWFDDEQKCPYPVYDIETGKQI